MRARPLWFMLGARVARPVDGGGPPTIADFNGDSFADVGAAGAVGYVVLTDKFSRMMAS